MHEALDGESLQPVVQKCRDFRLLDSQLVRGLRLGPAEAVESSWIAAASRTLV